MAEGAGPLIISPRDISRIKALVIKNYVILTEIGPRLIVTGNFLQNKNPLAHPFLFRRGKIYFFNSYFAFSCPQAARMSAPLLFLMIAVQPESRSAF